MDMDMEELSVLRIFTTAGEKYSLAIRDGAVVLAPTDPKDKRQHWVQDYSSKLRDSNGLYAFALINKATGEALQKSGENQPVQLTTYKPSCVNESFLWTRGSIPKPEGGVESFAGISAFTNSSLVFNLESETAKVGSKLVLSASNPITDSKSWTLALQPDQPTFRLNNLAAPSLFLSIRNGVPVLVPEDASDVSQHWIKDTRLSCEVDIDGCPLFSLRNKSTGQFLRHVIVTPLINLYKLELISHDPEETNVDDYWTLSPPLSLLQGFPHIRVPDDTFSMLTIRRDAVKSSDEYLLRLEYVNPGLDETEETIWKITLNRQK